MFTRTTLALLCLLSTPLFIQAAPLDFTYTQTDAAIGSGTISGTVAGIPFSGPMPAATVIQNDATAEPLPAGIVGFITGGTDGNPGGGIGVHLGWSGTTVIQGTLGGDTYEIEVSLDAVVGTSHSYSFDVFDDNSGVGGTNDVTNTLTHRGWIGDNGSGHRHSDGSFGYGAGADTFTAAAAFSLASGATGDSLGITAGVGPAAPNGTLFVDQIAFDGILNTTTDTPTLLPSVPEPSAFVLAALSLLLSLGFIGWRRRR